MPLYAPFGNAIYGQTLFGVPPSVSTFTTLTIQPPMGAAGTPSPYRYSGLQIDWAPAAVGQFTGQMLVRSAYGIPTSIYDGTILVSQLPQSTPQAFVTQFVDTGLKSGQFYYYTLFVFSITLGQWIVSGTAQGLVLIDWGFYKTIESWMPDWYLEQDATLATGSNPDGPLDRYLELIGFEADWVRSEIESLTLLSNVDLISGSLLPYLGANYGMAYEPVLGMTRSRVLVKNAVYLYKNRGTARGIAAAASAFSGYGAKVSIGKNLSIQLDDSAFDRSTGHWVPANSTSSVTTASVFPLNVAAQHTQYNPIPYLTNPISNGYLPPNATNVAVITSGISSGSLAWNPIAPTTSPVARTNAGMVYNATTSTTFLFGGFTNVALNDIWAFSGTSWTNVTPPIPVHPTARYGVAMAYDTATGNAVLFGGANSGTTALNDTWLYNGATNVWTQASPATVPPARTAHGMAYDAATGVVIMYGGSSSPSGSVLSDTWSWNGLNWTLLHPSKSPGPLMNFAMAYNPPTSQIITFGGATDSEQYEDDTWAWTGTTWTELSGGVNAGAPSPTARNNAEMVYDATGGNIVLFGGYSGSGALADTWTYTGTTWAQVFPATSPPGRYSQHMVYDAATAAGGQRIVMFGGNGGAGGILNDTWTWNGTTWAHPTPATSPPVRQFGAVTYDTVHSTVVLFGGFSSTYLSDTWTWNGTTWTQRAVSTAPVPRYSPQMAYDTVRNVVILFGGAQAGGAALNDLWSWNGVAWTQLAPIGGPPPARFNGAMAYDISTGLIMLFGGESSAGGFLSDTWSYNAATNTWASITPATIPTARYGHSMAWDAANSTMVMFGGQSGATTYLADTWNWTGANWVLYGSVPTSPTARADYSLAYDAATTAVVLHGGVNGTGYLGDSWYWNGTTWTAIISVANPAARAGATAVYSAAISAVVLFGGWGNSGALNDTWLLTGAAVTSTLQITTCTSATATTLGLPILQQATPPVYVVSAYFQPYPIAPTVRSFSIRIDWYGVNGVLISSTTGAAVTEVVGQWVRAYAVGSPPAGALTFGKTVQSTTALSGDLHLMDASQTEINTQATPGPSSWEPPRDIKVNLLPLRQNLIANPAGLGGAFGWTITNGGFVGTSTGAVWPATTTGGWLLTANGAGNMIFATTAPVNPGLAYTFSAYLQPVTTARTVYLVAQFFSGTGASLGSTQTTLVESLGGFNRGVNANLLAPTGAATATLQLIVVAPVNTEGHYVGAVMFEPLSYLRPYFDANFAPALDYTFEGNPNQSISDYYPGLVSVLNRLATALADYVPIGSTFSLITGSAALTNTGLVG